VQVTGLAPVHVPAWHVSVFVHALPSLQVVPSGSVGLEQTPFAGLQTPATWHWSFAVQVMGLAPVQVPAWQVSVCVQALPSLHVEPLALMGFEHAPAEHVPATWHWSEAVHTMGVPAQAPPAEHTSFVVHGSPSSQVEPPAFSVTVQPPAPLHVDVVWHCVGVHVYGVPPHVPLVHTSLEVHATPSLHVVPLVTFGFVQVPEVHVPA
jgi:hypothetical protein